MSFPPRPPLGMAPLPPGMMGPGYFAPMPSMGMVPVGMGMMPPTTVMRPIVTTSSAMPPQMKPKKQLVPQEIPKDDKDDEKPPVTTVFVGNISERAPDAMIRQMLQRCGNVLSWKRVQGASGKLQAFGFCEFEDPEATFRCMRLLNEWEISEKKLVVKVDAKTKTLLDEYRQKRRDKLEKEKEKESKENGDEEKEGKSPVDEIDEFAKREDRVAKAGLDAIMIEYAGDLAKAPPSESEKEARLRDRREKKEKKEEEVKDLGIDDMELEDDKKEIINREIRSFRDLHKILSVLCGKQPNVMNSCIIKI